MMKVKKQKRHRKAVTFYKACFGFRVPFKVLCDGTFIHHIVVNDFPSHEKALSNALGGSVKVFTTRCVMAELKSLGKSYAESLKAAQGDFMIARCDHETRKGAVACITEIVGEKNSEHFFVATQDTELRKKLQEIPGVPLMFALRNAVLLEKPSSFQLKFVKSAEEGRMHMADWESQLSQKRLHDILITEENENQVSIAEALDKRQTAKKSIDMKDKVQSKRKRPKGPNPLSCKKKKKKKNPVGSNSNMERIPGVPLMFALRNAVLLEKPSSFQLKFVKSAEEGRMHMADWESQLSQKRLHDILITEENENQVSIAEALDKRQTAKKSIDMKDKVQSKRKRPKGPNPLSCKKKKKKKNPVGSNSNMERVKKEGIESTGSRRRKRKRSRKSKREAPESGGQP